MPSIRYLFCILLPVCLLSCTKDSTGPDANGIIRTLFIDSVIVEDFNNVRIYAAYYGRDSFDNVIRGGIVWGSSPDSPAIYGNVLESRESSFMAYLKDIGEGKTIYCKAFISVDTTNDMKPDLMLVSRVQEVKTSGLRKLWEKQFPDDHSWTTKVLLAPDDHFLLLGTVTISGKTSTQISKIDKSGNFRWKKAFHPGEAYTARDIIGVKDGYLVPVHYEQLYSTAVAVMKIDHNGNLLWEQKLPINTNSSYVRLRLIDDNSFAITIRSNTGYAPGPVNPTLTDYRYDQKGNMLSRVSVPNDNRFKDGANIHTSATMADSSYVVANQAWWYDPPGSTSTTTDAILHRFDKNNRLLWEMTYGSNASDFPSNVIANKEGTFTIIGNTLRINNTYSLWLFNVNPLTGKMLWEYVFAGVANKGKIETTGTSVAMSKDGDYYVTGTILSNGQAPGVMYLQKVSKGGRFVWHKAMPDYFGSGDDVYVSDTGEIYLFGARTASSERIVSISKWQEL